MTSPEKSVPYGFCHCGCGGKTNPHRTTNSTEGVKKGDPQRYIRYHQASKGPNRYERVIVDGEACIKMWLLDDRYAIVDEASYPLVSVHRWFFQWATDKKTYYARTNIRVRTGQGGQKTLLMHNLLMASMSDHRNHHGFDNRRSNLRPANWQQNGCNKKKHTVKSSQYKGVRPRGNGTYTASIGYKGRTICLGTCKSEVGAAHMYDDAARRLHGEFASTNF